MNEKGFTLTETLFVFSIFLIIASITLINLKPQSTYFTKQLFFSQFKSDLFYAQQYAISHQTVIRVNIISDRNYYYIREKFDGQLVLEREFPMDVKVTPGSMPLYFEISANGNLNYFGTYFITIGTDKYRMVFLIGSGRVYVEKE
ncbi:competence type IV pilus minor pilin ComGD [Bacillus marasmi]|uniref:competence type IV pilus minor pilin ComGD n=1 Tax=Bacillus marasmi TaxID=1926279 RepID=UPI0011C714FD|nr:competence type IV pilus minor pilin ComGD [Bacillus marasmi]